MTAETRPTPRRHTVLGAWAVREVASFHLGRVAGALAAEGLPLMVLKGMWLQHYAYRDADDRPFADLDLLVRRADLPRVETCLVALGYRLLIDAPGDVARLYVSEDGFQLDLHYDLFPDGLFRLRGDAMIARGRRDEVLAGAPVLVPEPYDGFAHLVGHFVKGRHGPGDTKLLRDFEELARAAALLPDVAAAHLVDGGLRRAGLYALQFARDPESFAARTRARLPPDPVGEHVVRAIGVPHAPEQPQRPGDRLFAFALDHDLPSGARACARRLRALVREGGVRRVFRPTTLLHEDAK